MARKGGLAELVTALQNVGPPGTVRAVRSVAAKFPVVVAVVAVRAEDARADGAAWSHSIFIHHERAQTWLGVSAGAIVSDGMAGRRNRRKLGNDVQRIAVSDSPDWQITKRCGIGSFTGARAVASQTVFVLIDGRIQDGSAVDGVDTFDAALGRPDCGSREEGTHLKRRVRIVAVDARRVAVLIQQGGLRCIVRSASR